MNRSPISFPPNVVSRTTHKTRNLDERLRILGQKMVRKLRRRVLKAAGLIGVFLLLLVFYIRLDHYRDTVSIGNPIRHSERFEKELKLLEEKLNNVPDPKKQEKLDIIAEYIKERMEHLRTNASCQVALACGHEDPRCGGIGCQVHHRGLCALLSFSLGVPLIHRLWYWPYYDHWETVFKPLGSRCSLAETSTLYDSRWYLMRPDCPRIMLSNSSDPWYRQLLPPKVDNLVSLKNGIPMPPIIRDTLNAVHPKPFIWLIGLFMNYTMELQPAVKEEYVHWRNSFNASNVVGVHIRRTDKKTEAPDSVHDISEYAEHAQRFRKKNSVNSSITVYVATDDSSVLKEFQDKYQEPEWRVLGQTNDTTLSMSGRKSGFRSIVKDILMLTDSEFVVCGLSSNICRLIMELKMFRGDYEDRKFHSMERAYVYHISCAIPPRRVI